MVLIHVICIIRIHSYWKLSECGCRVESRGECDSPRFLIDVHFRGLAFSSWLLSTVGEYYPRFVTQLDNEMTIFPRNSERSTFNWIWGHFSAYFMGSKREKFLFHRKKKCYEISTFFFLFIKRDVYLKLTSVNKH